MTIDGEDIIAYGAEQWNVTMDFSSISNGSEWNPGSASPLLLSGETGLKKIKVSVMMKGVDRVSIWENGSRLVARLLQPSVIKLDGFSHNYYLVLQNAEQVETSLQRWHKATLEFAGYEYGDEVSVSTTAKTITITNPGNLDTPAVVEMVPLIGKASIIINGIVRNRLSGEGKAVTVNRLTKDKKISLDGETGLITEAGINKFPDVSLWDLPSLLPGKNIITWNQDSVNVTIKYKPRYL